jgi:hypothetical protein
MLRGIENFTLTRPSFEMSVMVIVIILSTLLVVVFIIGLAFLARVSKDVVALVSTVEFVLST